MKKWIVRIECTVLKEVTCTGCTEEEARLNPWKHAQDEIEVDQRDWEVKSVVKDK